MFCKIYFTKTPTLNISQNILCGLRMWLIVLFLLSPFIAKAQYGFDAPVVEAYIDDHKQVRSLLMLRATLEQGNAILHECSADAAKDYQNINDEFDRYTRAFDVIDAVYQGLRLAMNVYTTIDNVSTTISKYQSLVNTYRDKVFLRGSFEGSDTVIVTIAAKGISMIGNEVSHLTRSVGDLVLYVSGAAACSTANLVLILESINRSLDDIERAIRRVYYDTWRYMQVRMGYWKSPVYNIHTRRQLVKQALERWVDSSHEAIK